MLAKTVLPPLLFTAIARSFKPISHAYRVGGRLRGWGGGAFDNERHIIPTIRFLDQGYRGWGEVGYV